MIYELQNKLIPNLVFCFDVLKIEATFWCTKASQAQYMAEYIMTKPNEITLVSVSDTYINSYFQGVEHLKRNIDTLPDVSVDEFLDTIETVRIFKEQINYNSKINEHEKSKV
jgi:hypothetical protein